MSKNRKHISETAAGGTGAGAIAGDRGRLFGGKITKRDLERALPNPKNVQPWFGKKKKKSKKKEKVHHLNMLQSMLREEKEAAFDPSDVVSKLRAAEKAATVDVDTAVFGIEDDEGNIIKIYIPSDQADSFEDALASAMSYDNEDDDEPTKVEVAEILFDLRHKFDIIDIEWPEIPEDEEEEQEVGDNNTEGEGDGEAPQRDGNEEGDMQFGDVGDEEGTESTEDGGEDEMVAGEMPGGEDDDMKSTLQQVIDMMLQQAKATAAEAKAKQAEAEAEKARYAAQAAEARIKKQEEVLDMEAYYDKKNEKKKEASELAKLAKFRHEKAQEAGDALSSGAVEDNEELDNDTKLKFFDFMMRSLRSQG